MAWLYLGELLKRVFFPTTRGADYASVLVPLLIAAGAFFAGFKVSADTTTQVLAYLGALTVVVFLTRLFFFVPYTMWKEQTGLVSNLQLELARPERLVLEHLARHRAKARAKLSASLEDLQTMAFIEGWDEGVQTRFSNKLVKIRRFQAEAGLSAAFQQGRFDLQAAIKREGAKPNSESPLPRESQRLLSLLQRHLIGDLTAEALALQLPPGTAPETQP